jgi:hypothetical protein
MNETPPAAVPGTLSVPPVWIGTSVVVSVLVTISSLAGILLETTYSRETSAWALQAIAQDYANLVVVMVLLVSTYCVAKHSIRGYLVWLGAYLYLVYAFMIYAFAIHFQFLFLVYLLILGLSFYTLAGGLMAVDPALTARVLRGNPATKPAAALLLVIGVIFGLLWLAEIMPNLLAGTVPAGVIAVQLPVNPVHVLDLAFLLPGMIITAFLLWNDHVTGYIMAVPLLVFAATMSLGIILIMVFPAIHGLPYALPALVICGVIMVMSTRISFRLLQNTKP